MTSADPTTEPPERDAGRPQTLFEDYPNCPRLPLPPVQSARDPDALASLRVKDVPVARWLVRAALRLTGFETFRTARPDAVEACLSRDDGSRPVTGPLFSAVLPLVDDPETVEPCVRAARLLRAVWDLHADIRAGRFEPDFHHGRPLESRGYLNLFGTRFVFDGSSFRVFKTGHTGRMVVASRCQQFAVDLCGPDERPSVERLTDTLRHVWESSATAGHATQDTLGTLSCAGQATQCDGFHRLLGDPSNRDLYELVKHSFVVVCLDLDATPQSYAESARVAFSGNCANRWFHASLQIVVFGNGKACLICNPDTGLSGNAMMRAGGEIHRRSIAAVPAGTGPEPASTSSIRPLTWNLAEVPFDRVRDDLSAVLDDQQATFDLPGVGRVNLRARGFSPVELFVVAVQLATFRLTGRVASISQFVTTARYRCGSMTTALVSTPEMEAFQTALETPAMNTGHLRGLFDAAVDSQKTACRAARSRVPLSAALALFRSSQTGARRRYVTGVLRRLIVLIRTLGLDDEGRGRDVVLSHPAIVPEVPMLGRPGVRLPYVRYFALHYQMLDDRTRLTVMPGPSWKISNADLAAALGSAVDVLLTRLDISYGRHRHV